MLDYEYFTDNIMHILLAFIVYIMGCLTDVGLVYEVVLIDC